MQKLSLILLITLAVNAVTLAQTRMLNNVHANQHNELLANQMKINKEINLLDSTAYRYLLQEEEELHPALELYGDNWDVRWVNPYRSMGIKLPDSLNIDVSKYCMPHNGYITSNFGPRRRRMHNGIDLKVQVGDTIRAAFDGRVRLTQYERKGYGYYVVIRHNNGLETVYGHLSGFIAQPDQVVKAGDPIGLGGNTGRSTGSHLHFETRLLGVALNPNAIFDFENQVPHTDVYCFRAKSSIPTNTFASSSTAAHSAVHKVRKGDTLGSISRRYGVSVAKLCKVNNITTKTILKIGRPIRLG